MNVSPRGVFQNWIIFHSLQWFLFLFVNNNSIPDHKYAKQNFNIYICFIATNKREEKWNDFPQIFRQLSSRIMIFLIILLVAEIPK